MLDAVWERFNALPHILSGVLHIVLGRRALKHLKNSDADGKRESTFAFFNLPLPFDFPKEVVMPYEKTDAKIEELTKQALTDPEIDEGMKEARLEESDALDEIKKRADEVWGGVSSEIARYESAEREIQNEKEEIKKALGVPSDLDDDAAYVRKEAPAWVSTMGGVSFLLGIGSVYFLWKTYSGGGWKLTGSLVALIVAVIGVAFFYIKFFRWETEQDKKKETRETWKAKLNENYESAGINRFVEGLKNQEQVIAKLILEKKIKPLIRAMINPRLEPSYEPYFGITKAPGLAEAFDPSQTIDTTAKRSLAFHLNNMSGGSIGIAGPRGAGKSTLIRSYCGEKRTVASSKDEQLVTVLVSAPVEYQARDFILYLFSTLCNSVLEKLGKPFDPSALQEVEIQKESPFATVRLHIPMVLRIFFYVGLILVIASVVIAAIQVSSPSAQPTQQQPTQQPAQQQTPQQTAPGPASPGPTTQPALMRLLAALEIKPGFMLTLGITLLTLSFVFGVILGAGGHGVADTLRFYFSPLLILLHLILIQPIRSRMKEADQKEETKPAVAEQQKSPEEIANERKKESLVIDTNRWLKKIRFQQSYTSGWTGAIKLPVGFESGISNATTLAENQMSLPEITHSFTRYIEKLTREHKYKVVIGIDELDKLENDEKAQRFLNEIKSIFGLEGCFYLVSVSENAISSFERRGLPFRDVFDSSFDHIIYVDYLNFTGAKKLIQQRVIGRPIPFFALSYCLSGGLARDLIRTLRQLVELNQHPQATPNALAPNSLTSLCHALIRAELKSKIRSIAFAAKRIELEKEVGDFLEEIYNIETQNLSPKNLFEISEQILAKGMSAKASSPTPANSQKRRVDEDKEKLVQKEKLNVLREELAIYIEYLATLLEFFNDTLKEDDLKKVENDDSDLDRLARARQMMVVDPEISRKCVAAFRQKTSRVFRA
jgi:hypothetical protein